MKPNTTWPLLVKKAEDVVSKRLKEHLSTLETMQKLEASRQRIQEMLEGYKRKLHERQQQTLSMAENTNFREFMSQLLKLIERVDVDMERARMAQQQAKQRLLEAEIALFKMQSMVEKDARAVAAHRRRLEQRQLDAMGIAQFNLKQAANPAPASGSSAA